MIVLALYVIGSVSSARILTYLLDQQNPQEYGSGNLGFSNVYGNKNKRTALIVAIIDILKGFIACLVGAMMGLGWQYGACALLLGNLVSCFNTSGKGMACLMGISIYINSNHLLLPLIWFVGAKLSYASVASLIIASYLIVYCLKIKAFALMAMIGLVIYKHKGNIKRLSKHQERSL